MADLVSHRDRIANLLATYRTKDPRFVQIIETLMDDLHETIVTINPIKEVVDKSGIGDTTPPDDVLIILVNIFPFNIQLTWTSVEDAQFYEIRAGTDWATATFILKTSSLGASLNPLLVGTHNYLIKAINRAGIYSVNATVFVITIPPLGTITVTGSIIDNNILLYWTIPTSSFAIDHYNLYKDTVKFAEVKGTFISKFEQVAGTFTYEIEAVDVAGNLSPKGIYVATLRQPPDFVLLDDRLLDLTLAQIPGSNTFYDGVGLVACVDVEETFEDHFTSESWDDPQEQVDAGFERYIQENLLTGFFIRQYDYGGIIENAIVNYTYIKENFSGAGDVTVEFQTYYRDNMMNPWLGPLVGNSVFIAHFIQMRTDIIFTAANSDCMIRLKDVHVRLDVKRDMDSGQVSALASDTGGTVVNFNKSFRDVEAIECTTKSSAPIYVVVDFVDIANPTFFKVLVYDSAGRRIDQLVYWMARGLT